jgi:hypothetical protein
VCVQGRCTFKAGYLDEPSEIQVTQLFAYLACARLRRRSGCQRYSAGEREGGNVRLMKGVAVRESSCQVGAKGAVVKSGEQERARLEDGARTRARRGTNAWLAYHKQSAS